ncbi:hypothetical protein EON68_00290 [archaeon]|nr:MAG: hypothetical protein EON68_00290 [archaeon]
MQNIASPRAPATRTVSSLVYYAFTPAMLWSVFGAKLTMSLLRDSSSLIAWGAFHIAFNYLVGARLLGALVAPAPHMVPAFRLAATFVNAGSVPLLLMGAVCRSAQLRADDTAYDRAVVYIFMYVSVWNVLFWSGGKSMMEVPPLATAPPSHANVHSSTAHGADDDARLLRAPGGGGGGVQVVDERSIVDVSPLTAPPDADVATSARADGLMAPPATRRRMWDVRTRAGRLAARAWAARGEVKTVLSKSLFTPPIVGLALGTLTGLWAPARRTLFTPDGWLSPFGDVITTVGTPAIPLSNLILGASLFAAIQDYLAQRRAARAAVGASPHGVDSTGVGGVRVADEQRDAHAMAVLVPQPPASSHDGSMAAELAALHGPRLPPPSVLAPTAGGSLRLRHVSDADAGAGADVWGAALEREASAASHYPGSPVEPHMQCGDDLDGGAIRSYSMRSRRGSRSSTGGGGGGGGSDSPSIVRSRSSAAAGPRARTFSRLALPSPVLAPCPNQMPPCLPTAAPGVQPFGSPSTRRAGGGGGGQPDAAVEAATADDGAGSTTGNVAAGANSAALAPGDTVQPVEPPIEVSMRTAVGMILVRLVICPALLMAIFVLGQTLGLVSRTSDPVLRLVVLVQSAAPSAQSVLLLCQLTGNTRAAKEMSMYYTMLYPASLLTLTIALVVSMAIVFGV